MDFLFDCNSLFAQIQLHDPRDILPFINTTIDVLHLFSGPRRDNDIHTHFDQLSHLYGLHTVVLSLDIVVDPVAGNLRSHGTIDYWRIQIRTGLVKAIIAGPPSGTWSPARFNDPEPSPLRDANNHWGLPGLSFKNTTKTIVGNVLFRATFQLALECAASGAAAIIEHPAPAPWQPKHICSFNIPEIQDVL